MTTISAEVASNKPVNVEEQRDYDKKRKGNVNNLLGVVLEQ